MDQDKASIRLIFYSQLARTDIAGIYEYTLNNWGEEQAERYVQGLLDLMAKVASGEQASRLLASKRGRRFVYFQWPTSRYRHRIIFQDLPDSVTVLRILHSAQKMPSAAHFDRLETDPPDQDPTP